MSKHKEEQGLLWRTETIILFLHHHKAAAPAISLQSKAAEDEADKGKGMRCRKVRSYIYYTINSINLITCK